jgi:hypothetical protein
LAVSWRCRRRGRHYDAASRELSEETGLVAGKLDIIGLTCNEPGLVQLRTTIFVATDLVKGERDIEHTEIGMKLKFFTIDQVEEMIKKGEIQCGSLCMDIFRNYLKSNEQYEMHGNPVVDVDNYMVRSQFLKCQVTIFS